MSQLAKDFRRFLLEDGTINAYVMDTDNIGRIHQNKVPQDKQKPFIWFGQSGIEQATTLDQQPGMQPFSRTFDVECVSPDINEALDLAEEVRDLCHCYRGELSADTDTTEPTVVQGIFVHEHDDQYFPKSIDGDEGLFVAALSIEIIPEP